MKKISTQFLTRTAIILALAIIFQNLRYLIGSWPQSTIIIGSLVNLCIIVATGLVGIGSGIFIGLVTPLVALAQGHLPHPLFAPVTMAGNIAIAAAYYYITKFNIAGKLSDYAGVIAGALIKWAVMYYVGVAFVLNIIVKGSLKPKAAQLISINFNVPQFITAIIGGLLGVIIIRIIKTKINKS